MSISRLNDLESTHFSPTTKEYLTRINTSATRMRHLIDDLLMFSRVSKVGNLFHTTDLNDLLLKSKIDLTQLITEKNAEIESTILPTLKVIPFQIQQLFVNLIGNALKYSKSNSQSIIKISSAKVHDTDYPSLNLEAHKRYYAISVSDNGIGFEKEYADKIFELFYRLPHADSNYTGTGVGLKTIMVLFLHKANSILVLNLHSFCQRIGKTRFPRFKSIQFF